MPPLPPQPQPQPAGAGAEVTQPLQAQLLQQQVKKFKLNALLHVHASMGGLHLTMHVSWPAQLGLHGYQVLHNCARRNSLSDLTVVGMHRRCCSRGCRRRCCWWYAAYLSCPSWLALLAAHEEHLSLGRHALYDIPEPLECCEPGRRKLLLGVWNDGSWDGNTYILKDGSAIAASSSIPDPDDIWDDDDNSVYIGSSDNGTGNPIACSGASCCPQPMWKCW